MIFEHCCYNIKIRYYENLIKVNIVNIKNNIEMYLLNIFQLNLCNMIIKYRDIEYLIFYEKDLKRIFKIL